MAFEDYSTEIQQRDFENECYKRADKEDRINNFGDRELADELLLDLFGDPDEWFVVGLNFRSVVCLQWFLDTGYAQVVMVRGIAKITQRGIQYLDEITS